MGLFDAIGELVFTPVRCAKELIDDVSGNNDEADAGLSIVTLGGSSIIKGVAKSIQRACDKFDE